MALIIQIFRNNVVPFPKRNAESNGDYEYKFRVLNNGNRVATAIFDRSYTVKICKVEYLNQNNVI